MILITGGAGFIGCNFIYTYLKEHPHETIINIDKLTYAGNMNNFTALNKDNYLKDKHIFIQEDITNTSKIKAIFEQYKHLRCEPALENYCFEFLGCGKELISVLIIKSKAELYPSTVIKLTIAFREYWLL